MITFSFLLYIKHKSNLGYLDGVTSHQNLCSVKLNSPVQRVLHVGPRPQGSRDAGALTPQDIRLERFS